MIYLVGGAPRCGKTTLTAALARRGGLSWVSTDHLRQAIFPYIDQSIVKRARANQEELLAQTPEAVLAAELEEAHALWPGIKAFIAKSTGWHKDFAVEGVHLLPSLVAEFRDTPLWPLLKVAYVVKTDAAAIYDGFRRSDPEKDWLLRTMTTEPALRWAAEMIRVKGAYFAEEARKHGFAVANTQDDFQGSIDGLLEMLLTQKSP